MRSWITVIPAVVLLAIEVSGDRVGSVKNVKLQRHRPANMPSRECRSMVRRPALSMRWKAKKVETALVKATIMAVAVGE